MKRDVFLAAKNGHLKILQDIHRENPQWVRKAVSFQGNSVIHIAAREGHFDIVSWMLGLNSCMAFSWNADRNTPLHEAAKDGNPKMVELLLKYSHCSAAKRNQFGETPLIIASDHGHVEAAKLLLDATPLYMVFWPRDDRRTCLNAAVYGGHLDVLKLILNKKLSCFKVVRLMLLIGDSFGATPLHVAVRRGDVEIVREILKTRWSLCWGFECLDDRLMTKKDNLGRCAVHIAAIRGHWDIMDEFMKAMPDCVEIRSTSLQTALHSAVECNQFHIVQKLLSQSEGVVNGNLVSFDCDMYGSTVLHLAAMNGVDQRMMEYLLSFPNVSVNAINNEGLTALDIALSKTKDFQDEPNFATIKSLLTEQGATEGVRDEPNPNNNSARRWPSYQSNTQNGSTSKESKILDVDTLLASLIATVSFAAIFQVPGGIDERTKIANWSLRTVFKVFLFSDCVALFASLSVVVAWIFRERVKTKLVADRSLLAKFSLLRLGISVVATGLAFLSATILVTIPRHLNSVPDKKKKQEYKMILNGEILTAFVVPSLALVFLSMAWLIQYYFKATNEQQLRLRWELKRVLISTIPVATTALVILFTYVIHNI